MTTLTLTPTKNAQLQHGTSGTEDTNVSGAVADVLSIRNQNPAVGEVLRHIVSFDLSTLPPKALVTAATLKLYSYDYSGPTGVTFRVYQITQPWVESEVTWNSYKTGSLWATAGGDYGTGYAEDTTLAAWEAGLANTLDVLSLITWHVDPTADFIFKFATELEPTLTYTEAQWDSRLGYFTSPPELVIEYTLNLTTHRSLGGKVGAGVNRHANY